MTKEETISNLKAYLDGDTAIGNIIPLRSVLESAIKYLEPSLPSNLDEAAKRIAYDVCKQLPNGEEKDGIVYYAILAAIAGAEWIAEQGAELTGTVHINGMGQAYLPPEYIYLSDMDLREGDKVIVQIRKK